MEKKKGSGSGRSFAKLAAFLVILSLLALFSQVKIPVASAGSTALPASARSSIMVKSINGIGQTVLGTSHSEDGNPSPEPVSFRTSNLSNVRTVMTMGPSEGAGCQSTFRETVEVTFTTVNELSVEVKGTANVTVQDTVTGVSFGSHLLPMDFKPGVAVSATTSFYVATPEVTPTLLVKIGFPSADELGSASATVSVPLFEYLLVKAGLLSADSP